MHYGQVYSAPFDEVAVTAVQDLYELLLPSDVVVVLHRLLVTQSSDAGDAEDEQLHVTIRRVTGSPTSGSGGSTVTPVAHQAGSAAAGSTVEINNTTQLSGGTNTVIHAESFNIRAGLDYHPVPEDRISFSPSTRLLVELETAPADSVTMSGVLVFEEIGG